MLGAHSISTGKKMGVEDAVFTTIVAAMALFSLARQGLLASYQGRSAWPFYAKLRPK
jgi:hypothetical protein